MTNQQQNQERAWKCSKGCGASYEDHSEWYCAEVVSLRELAKAALWWRDNEPNRITEPASHTRSLKRAVDAYREGNR